MSGVKVWHVRPTDELLKNMEMTEKDELLEMWNVENQEEENATQMAKTDRTKLSIPCAKGDMLLINTRLWWHSTTLPVQGKCNILSTTKKVDTCTMHDCVPSVSYARDIYIGESYDEVNNPEKQTHLTNVDGLYAANDIEAGTILFRESEMPDCELHRTRSNPNCELVELDDGEGAVISCRDIKAGEFFCMLESDDSCSEQDFESDDDDSEEEEEEDDSDDDDGEEAD
jgi:U3 small nucleolar RNA-associated protein 6